MLEIQPHNAGYSDAPLLSVPPHTPLYLQHINPEPTGIRCSAVSWTRYATARRKHRSNPCNTSLSESSGACGSRRCTAPKSCFPQCFDNDDLKSFRGSHLSLRLPTTSNLLAPAISSLPSAELIFETVTLSTATLAVVPVRTPVLFLPKNKALLPMSPVSVNLQSTTSGMPPATLPGLPTSSAEAIASLVTSTADDVDSAGYRDVEPTDYEGAGLYQRQSRGPS